MKKNILFLVIGLILGLSVAAGATILYNAKDIEFTPSDASWNVNNMQDAINDIKENYTPNNKVNDLINQLTSWEYEYTGNYETVNIPIDGRYKIELWGAQGANFSEYIGGYGAYTSGIISLKSNDKLYVYVGGSNGYNGGNSLNSSYGANGGGSTDIRLVSGAWNNFDSLKSRIMVAAGGGSAEKRGSGYGEGNGGAGGGLIGYDGQAINYSTLSNIHYGFGGTQIKGGYLYNSETYYNVSLGVFGQAGGATTLHASGGSGYYGGGGSYHGASGGGSSFISGHSGCNAITSSSTSSNIVHTGQENHYSMKVFTNTVMIDGNGFSWTNEKGNQTGMPTHDGTSTMTGNAGNGYAKITLISLD